ncbi:MAG: PilZ domain-containing protein [Oligoflexia bacterium]
MKVHLSRLYQTLVLFYLAFPITFLLVTALLYEIPGSELTKILLQPSFYLLSLGAMITGFGLWEVRRWGWYAMRFMSLAMIYYSVVLLVHYGQTDSPGLALFVGVLMVWVLDKRISSELRVPYFMPQISWWESNPRYQIRIPVRVLGHGGEVLEGQILDVSLAGCFIKIRPEFTEQSPVTLECQLFGRPWRAEGAVVWRTYGAVTFPRGIGVKFSPMERSTRRALSAATLRVRKLALLYRRGRFLLGDDELKKAIEKLKSPIPPHHHEES